MNPHTYGQLTSTKETRIYNGEKQSLQQMVFGKLVACKSVKLEYTITS